jgi:secondary thiamine-phosphate synthase enzyme
MQVIERTNGRSATLVGFAHKAQARRDETHPAALAPDSVPNSSVAMSAGPTVVQTSREIGLMQVATTTLRYETECGPQFIDITDEVVRAAESSGVTHGIAVVFSRHTTAAIKINEHEPELLKDMKRFLGEIAPQHLDYYHNNFEVRWVNMQEDECPNAHAHCQHLLMSTSETIPVMDGKLMLGRWQRIFLVELDHPRSREVVVRTVGC